MPTYQYTCTDCGEPLEVVQAFSDDALTECPACGGKLRKVYGAVGVVFKGSGFYRNDSRGKEKTSAASTSSSSDSSSSTPAVSSPSSDSSSTSSTPAPPASTPAPSSKPSSSESSGSSAA